MENANFIKNLDFKHGDNGEGNIIITLPKITTTNKETAKMLKWGISFSITPTIGHDKQINLLTEYTAAALKEEDKQRLNN